MTQASSKKKDLADFEGGKVWKDGQRRESIESSENSIDKGTEVA